MTETTTSSFTIVEGEEVKDDGSYGQMATRCRRRPSVVGLMQRTNFGSWRKRSDAANLGSWVNCFVERVCIHPI
jgi:hypothetical protein